MKKYAHFRNNIRILVAVEPPSQQNNNPSDETTKKKPSVGRTDAFQIQKRPLEKEWYWLKTLVPSIDFIAQKWGIQVEPPISRIIFYREVMRMCEMMIKLLIIIDLFKVYDKH
jgi:hypothetical protein